MSQPTPPCVILDHPQLAENIGAVARVMANFGLTDLRIVAPQRGWPQQRAWEASSGADWVLDDAKLFDSLEPALADLQLVHATTARPREAVLPVLTPREGAANTHAASAEGLKVGLLFGPERAGLEKSAVALAHAIVTIPVDARHHSLNLAQAVAINAYEWRLTVSAGAPPQFRDGPPPAEGAMMLGLFEHLESELEEAGFFHPPEKRPSMIRNLRVALGRARLNDQEVRTFRGVITALSKGRGQTLARLTRSKD